MRKRDPRVVVGIIFPTGSIYLTNRTGISNVPGTVISGVLTELSATSQEVYPEEGRSTIGTLTFSVVDLAGAVTTQLRDQLLTQLRGVRGRDVRVYTGDTDDFTDGTWTRVETYVVDGVRLAGRKYAFSCSDRSRAQRVDVFDRKTARLTTTLAVGATSVVVDSTTGFSLVPHNAAFTDAPSATVAYIRIEQTGEIIRYTDTSGGNTFTGCTRGCFGTIEQECVVDAAVSNDRRPEITEFVYLESPAPVLDYAIKTGVLLENLIANGGGEIGTTGSQATSWTLNAGNNLVIAADASRVGARSLKIVNAGVTDSSSRQDFTVVGGATYVVEGFIKTSALPTADAGYGAVINVDIVSGVASYTILEKIGDDPSASVPDVGLVATAAERDWTYVRCKFIPNANGTLRLMCQLGYGGGQSGTAWFDGVRVRRVAQLPTTWHMGIDESLVDSYQYEQIGVDLYDPADVTAGLVLRFTHLEKTDGKRFCEEQLHVPMQTYAPIDANGVIGIRRIVPVIAAGAPTAVLGPNTVIKCDAIEHSLAKVCNRVVINWNYDGEKYTRRDVYIHAGSIAKHKVGQTVEFSLRGLTVQRHSRTTMLRLVNTIFERRAAPPIEATVTISRSLNALEIGDVTRMALPHIRDFTNTSTLDRAVELQGRRINWTTGALEGRVFGSTERMVPDVIAGSGAILSDAWYSSAGVALSTVLTMVGNAVTASGALAGNDDLRLAVYYHLGDLTINAGVVVTLGKNVQLRVRGTLTINGSLDGKGGGFSGLSSPHVVGQPAGYQPWPDSPVGWFGYTKASDGVWSASPSLDLLNFDGHAQGGANQVVPRLALSVASGALIGIPAELRGARGSYGPPVVSLGTNGTVVAKGGDGGAGGAGLMIVSRGTIAFGASGKIDLSGANGTAPPATGVLVGVTLYGGAGAGGAPGALYVILDGNNVTFPDLTSKFIASQGITPQTGTPGQYTANGRLTFPTQPGTGVGAGLSGADHWRSAHLVQYVPADVQLGAAQDEGVPAPTALTAFGDDTGVVLAWLSPPSGMHDEVEVWWATTNDRTGAVRLGSVRGNALSQPSQQRMTRYFWIRARDADLGYSAWQPVGSTSGVVATFGGGTFDVQEDFDYVDAAALLKRWTQRQGSGEVTLLTGLTDAPGGQALRFGNNSGNDEWWGALNVLIPYDGISTYEVGVIAKRSAGSGFTYCGFEGVAADGVTMVNTAGSNSFGSQHYVAAQNAAPGSGWTTYRGYLRGWGASPGSASAAFNDPNNPDVARTNVVYIRPNLLVNYSAAAGQTEVAGLWVRRIAGNLAAQDVLASLGDDADNMFANGGGEQGAAGVMATGWTGGAGSALVPTGDFAKFGLRSLKITNGSAANSYNFQDFNVLANEVYEISGWIRLSTASSGGSLGAYLNVDPLSGVSSFTVIDKITTGADPNAAQPDCGVEGNGGTIAFTFVRCRFIPRGSSGTIRVYCQLGYGGNLTGSGWWDGLVLRRLDYAETLDLQVASATDNASDYEAGPITSNGYQGFDPQLVASASLTVVSTDDMFEISASGRTYQSYGGSGGSVSWSYELNYRLNGGAWVNITYVIAYPINVWTPFAIDALIGPFAVGDVVEVGVFVDAYASGYYQTSTMQGADTNLLLTQVKR